MSRAQQFLHPGFGVRLLPFSDDFNRADGVLGGKWTGPTWAISSNTAVNAPTQGAELLSNTGFETAGGGGADVFANWAETALGGSTINDEGAVVHGGSHACRFDIDGSNSYAAVAQISATVGTWYFASAWARANAGTPSFLFSMGGVTSTSISLDTTYTQRIFTCRATAAGGYNLIRSAATSASLYFDDASLKALTLASLFASINSDQNDVRVQAEATLTINTQAGVVVNLDSAVAPANFVIGFHNGVSAKLVKCVAGIYTELITAVAAYGAGRVVQVRKSGTTYQLYYNGVQIGADQTINDAGIINNTIHGLFSTYAGNSLDDFSIEKN